MFEILGELDPGADEPALIEGIAALERLKAAASARQARLAVALDAARRQAEADAAGDDRRARIRLPGSRRSFPARC